MRTESGIALPLVMGLLAAVSLIGASLMSQMITSTKFYEAAGMSYVGLWNDSGMGALQNLDTAANYANLLKGNLVTSVGTTLDLTKDPNRTSLATVLYVLYSGNPWSPDWSKTFNDISSHFNNLGVWSMSTQSSSQDSTITSSFYTTSKKGMEESLFLFKDSNQPECGKDFNSYNLHVEFNIDISPKFGIYYNSNPLNQNNFFGNLFLISLIDGTFSINSANPGTKPPGQTQTVSFDAKDKNGNYLLPQFVNWTNASSKGTGVPFDTWHSIDISVQSQGQGSEMTTTVKIDGITVMSAIDKNVQPHFVPNKIGLSNWSGDNWGVTQTNPSSVTFRNISVTNTTPP